jgi:hypothetical protein
MEFKKLIILIVLFLGVTNQNILAMGNSTDECTINTLSVGIFTDILISILDFISPPDPMIPASYLRTGKELIAFAQASSESRNMVLIYTEKRIINLLLKFNASTGTINLNSENADDFVCACCAFKIISKIREIGFNDNGKNFCEPQFQALIQLFNERHIVTGKTGIENFFKEIVLSPVKEIVLSPVKWVKLKIRNGNAKYLKSALAELEYSRQNCNEEIFRAILDGEDINQLGSKIGFLSLFFAVVHGDLYLTQMLLVAGACVDACIVNNIMFDGFTVLHVAASHNNLAMVQLLLQFGANPTLLVNIENTAHRADSLTNNPDIKRVIQAACDKWAFT